MFENCTNLKVIRFEVNPAYIGKTVYIKDWKKMEYSVGVKGDDKYLILKYRINFIDPSNNDEVIGYLGEKHCKMKNTTIQNDRPTLVKVLGIL
jgi:hypothetical protein